jgi:hypothetical protein
MFGLAFERFGDELMSVFRVSRDAGREHEIDQTHTTVTALNRAVSCQRVRLFLSGMVPQIAAVSGLVSAPQKRCPAQTKPLSVYSSIFTQNIWQRSPVQVVLFGSRY